MKTAKHTPGPWVTRGDNIYNKCIRPHRIAKVFSCSFAVTDELAEKEKRLNAALIETAPELLEALKGLVREIHYLVDDGTLYREEVITNEGYQAAQAAIAKAEGRK